MNENTAFKQQDCEEAILNYMANYQWAEKACKTMLQPGDFTNSWHRYRFERLQYNDTDKQPTRCKTVPRYRLHTFDYVFYLCDMLKLLSYRREVYMKLHSAMQRLKDWRVNPVTVMGEL